MGDEQRLQQVLWNMVSNAAKFVSTGGHIFITAKADGDAIQLTIEDDGPGIPDDFLPFVFDQFRQADPSLTRSHGGLGLGLAISQNLVQLHGGTIEAANRPQGGAVFTVRLPAATHAPRDRALLRPAARRRVRGRRRDDIMTTTLHLLGQRLILGSG